jgi:hypothetical protein
VSTLAEFQQQFAHDLRSVSAVASGFAVYRNTVTKGLIDALAANYPTIERLVGVEWFAAAALVYVREHLPKQAALALYGDGFAMFLADFAPAAPWPYLPEVARLDRLWSEAHFAADAPALRSAQLAALPPQRLASVRLTLHPATRCDWFEQSAVTVWQLNRPPATPPDSIEIDGRAQGAVFVRPQAEIEMLKLTHGEYSFLSTLRTGTSLGEAAMTLLESDQAADVAGMLARFITAGVFTSIKEDPHE